LKVQINDKDNEIVSLRNQYFRLIEGFKHQVKEKQTVIEILSAEDAKKMKILLQLRNKIMDAEKTFER